MATADEFGQIRTVLMTVEDLRQRVAERKALEEGVTPQPPEHLLLALSEIMQGEGDGTQEARDWLKLVGSVMILAVPKEEFHPKRLELCSRWLVDRVQQGAVSVEDGWKAVCEEQEKTDQLLSFTRAEYDRAVQHLTAHGFLQMSDGLLTVADDED